MSKDISIPAARLAIAAVIIYQLLLIALIFIRPDLDPYWHPISEWALGRHGWIMVMAFLISAMSYSCLLVSVKREIKNVRGKIGLVLLFLCIIGTVGVGVFKTDPMTIITDPNPPPIVLSTTGTLHIICGGTAMFLLPFAAMLINLSLVSKIKWPVGWKRALMLTAIVPLLGLLGFIIHTTLILLPMGDYAYGPEVPLGWPARILFMTYMVWIITLGWSISSRELRIIT